MYQKLIKEITEGKVAPVYLFWGEERYLLQSAVNSLWELLAPNGKNDFNAETIDGLTASPSSVIIAANTMPFFSERKLVMVDNCPWFANKKKNDDDSEEDDKPLNGMEDLIAYLENPNPSTCLVFVAGDKINKTKRITKAAIKKSKVIEFKALQGESAIAWVNTAINLQGKSAEREAVRQLILASGSNFAFLQQEIHKLCAYVGTVNKITVADVNVICSKNTTTSVFEIIDAVANCNLSVALAKLEQVLLTEEPYMVVPLLAGHFHLMFLAKNLRQRGYGINEIASATGKNGRNFIVEKALRQSSRFTLEQLHKALEILLQADVKSKNGVSAPVPAIETAIMQICAMNAI